MKFIICVCFLRLMMQRVLWVLSSRPPSLTAAWQHSLVCPSKSSFCAPCQTGSKYVYACFFTWHAHLTLNIFYSVKFLCALIFCYFQLWPKLQYIFSISSQIDVCITPGTHASEEAGKTPQRETRRDGVLDHFYQYNRMHYLSYCLCHCVYSEQTAGRQRESGSSSGECISTGGGQPVSVDQEHLNSQPALLLSAFRLRFLQEDLFGFFENLVCIYQLSAHPYSWYEQRE